MTGRPISIDAARERVLDAVRPLGREEVTVVDALGRVLVGDLRAAGDVPPFANSAMDGYAVHAGPAGRRLRVVGESRAGRPATVAVGSGEAIRISTGAAAPGGATAVARVEDTREDVGNVVILSTAVEPGDNLRAPGEDLAAGAVVLVAGTALGPAELGVATSAGADRLWCARRPAVTVLTTGDELRPPGARLGLGQIHDSNAVALAALVERAGARTLETGVVADDREATETALAGALDASDVVVISGGVSVGAHDHVKSALRTLGVQERFWRVALKPGGPTWFGALGERLVFGLPGNPVSSMVTFVLFVAPALTALQGARAAPERTTARLAEPVARDGPREQALRVRLETREGVLQAVPNGPQGSHIQRSMLGARALALVPAGAGRLEAGEPVTIEAL